MTFENVDRDRDRLRITQIVILFLALCWGYDYLATPSGELTKSLTVVEQAAPIWVWGTAFLTFGTVGLLGEVWIEVGRRRPAFEYRRLGALRHENRWWPSYTAHSFLCALYVGVGVGYATNLVISQHLWGVRSPALMFSLAAVHWVFVNRRHNV